MTLVIATGGIDLRRGGDGYRRSHNGCDDGRGISLPIVLLSALALASWRLSERHTGSNPQN
ncbi:hypothetical protein ACLK1T_08820 [Escherichia coli]